MYSYLLRKLNIDRKESGFVVLLFISASLIGIFLSSFDIAAHALFLDTFNQKDLALAYLFSGMLGVIMFFIYSLAFKYLSPVPFYFVNLSITLITTFIYFYFYLFEPHIWSAFLGLVVMFPVNLLTLLNFWRYIRKQLHPAQSLRLLPIIEFGFVLGIICGSYGVIGILLFYDYFIIPIVTLSVIVLLFILQFPMNAIHRRGEIFNHRKDMFVPVKSSSFLMFNTNYTIYLFFFALISSVIGFLIHFAFINLARASFPNIVGMSKFYGLFIGCMYLFILVADRFLLHRILYSYDSPYSLVLLPFAMAGIIIVTLIFYFIFGNTTALSRFTFLFILLGMNKIVYESNKLTIQIPSLRALFRTLDIRFLQIIYPRIEGTLVMLGMLVAGGFIIVMLSAKFYSLFIILILCLVLACVWFFFAVKLIKAYKLALQDSYKKMRKSLSTEYGHVSYNQKIRKILVGTDPVRVINALKLSSHIEPITYENSLRRMLAHPDPIIQAYVLSCIREESLLDLLPELKRIGPASEESAKELETTIREFEKKLSMQKERHDLESMISSHIVKDRIFASEIIGTRRDLAYTSALVNLSREFEPEVKKAAVKAMARMSNADHSYILIELLGSQQFHAYAFETLVNIGEPAVEYLESLFINPGTDDNILSRAVRIYGKVGTPKCIDLLLNKIENQSRRVTMHAIEALHESKFQASQLNMHRILNFVVRVINTIGWNYLLHTYLPQKNKYYDLRMAYGREIEMSYELLFELLSLIYNPHAIAEIRQLIEEGSKADISHAIELLDYIIYDDIKPVLFPIIEDIPSKEVVKRLQYYFPIERMSEEEMISSTLTRDYNLLSLYPRICAMQLMLKMPQIKVSNELLSNLFHPNRLMREVAATVIYKKDPELFKDVAKRLDPDIILELTEVIKTTDRKDKLLLIDKLKLLRQTHKISQLDEEILIDISQSLIVANYLSGQTIDIASKTDEYTLFIILAETIQFNDLQIVNKVDGMYELYYSKILVNSGVSKIHFSECATVLSINNETVENLLFDYSEMANCVLSCVEQFKMAV